MSTWTESDEPALRWLHEQGSSFLPETWYLQLGLRDSVEPSDEVPGLSSEQMDQALTRLQEHGLIAGRRQETIGYASWSGLRLTAWALQVLGEWPDLDQLTSAVGMNSRNPPPIPRIRERYGAWWALSGKSARALP